MAEPPAKLVVRTYAPVRRLILGFAAALLGCFALYVAYELGRYDGGYDRLAAAQQRVELEVAIQNLEKQNRELRTQLAELDTVRVGQERERAEISRTIGELQAQVARQAQELAFYRGIVQQGAAALGVRIHELRISATEDPQRFELHLTLVRSVRPDDTVSGTIGLRVGTVRRMGARTAWISPRSPAASSPSCRSRSATSRTSSRRSSFPGISRPSA